MSVLVYCDPCQDACANLIKEIGLAGLAEPLMLCSSKEQMIYYFQETRAYWTVSVLLIKKESELIDMIDIHKLFDNLPIILVLPDKSDPSYRRKFELYPRYIADARDGFSDVGIILKNLVQRASKHLE